MSPSCIEDLPKKIRTNKIVATNCQITLQKSRYFNCRIVIIF